MSPGSHHIEPVAEISDVATGRLLIFGSATPGNQFVAQPVHVWTLTETNRSQPGDGLDDRRRLRMLPPVRRVSRGRRRVTAG